MKISYLYMIVFLVLGISCDVKKRKSVYLIPEKYSGWVKITFNCSESNIEMIQKDDDIYVLVIGGDPSDFRIKSPPLPGGSYEQEFFYYSEDTLYSSPNRHGLQSSLGSYGAVKRFYVTHKEMTSKEFYEIYDVDSLESAYKQGVRCN